MDVKEEELKNRIKLVLIRCREEKGISQKQLADYLKLVPTTVASWEQGISLPKIHTLYQLSVYYGKTIAEMYGEVTPTAADLRSDELKLIDGYRKLNDAGKNEVHHHMDYTLSKPEYTKNTGSPNVRAG